MTKLLLALCALLALPASAPAAEAASGTNDAQGSLLYVQKSAGTSVKRLDGGGFRLRLTGVSPRVSTFTDRPRRRAGSEGLKGFVGRWRANGFAADPPNAGLVLDRAPRSRDVALLTLSHPRYDRGRETLTYRATPLRGEDAGALASLARRGDPVRTGEFGAASLFVDNGGGAQLARIVLTFEEVVPGQGILIRTTDAAWSLGPPAEPVLIDGGPNGIQIGGFSLGPSSLQVIPASSASGTINFSVSLALEFAEGADPAVTLAGDPGGTITVAWPTSDGPEIAILSPGPTPLAGLVSD